MWNFASLTSQSTIKLRTVHGISRNPQRPHNPFIKGEKSYSKSILAMVSTSSAYELHTDYYYY
jgi:hypothetical protein